MLNKRVHILFENDFWNKLEKVAKKRQTSVGQLVRNAVEKEYQEESSMAERRELLEEIEKIRPHLKGKVDYKSLINHGRKY